MEKSFKTLVQCLCAISILIGLLACNKDNESSPKTTDCSVEVAECLTNGDRQVYFMYSSDGSQVTNTCWLSIQMGFESDGTFTWQSNSDVNENCMNLIGFENFTGQWTLENNKTEIHITPPWFTDNFQTETVLRIIELNQAEFKAATPNQTGATNEIIWRRL